MLCGQPICVGDGAGGDADRLAPDQQLEDGEPRRLAERGERGKRVRRGQVAVARRRGPTWPATANVVFGIELSLRPALVRSSPTILAGDSPKTFDYRLCPDVST